jgi:hypothetical protein
MQMHLPKDNDRVHDHHHDDYVETFRDTMSS